MNRFVLMGTPLPGLIVVERAQLGDDRGYLSRMFCASELASAGWSAPIAQINHTFTSRKGTVRGMHFQRPPHSEVKLVSCLRGEIWDVAVDIRKDSSTFLRWHAEVLSSTNRRALLIGEGFAHGFQALTDDVELLYCHSVPHFPSAEGGLRPTDDRLRIPWPIEISQLSRRDAEFAPLTEAFEGLET